MQTLQTVQSAQQKNGSRVWLLDLGTRGFLGFTSIEDSPNLLTLFYYKVTIPFISGTHFWEEPPL